jgi:hypothetical protein
MAAMFLGNAAGCTAILLIGAWKRTQHRSSLAEPASQRTESLGTSVAGGEERCRVIHGTDQFTAAV